MGKEIILTPLEFEVAVLVGTARHRASLEAGDKPAHGCREDEVWRVHIEGACGEMAAAKTLGLYWGAPIGNYRSGGDVGTLLQVRTRSKHDYDHLIRHNDRPNAPYLLMTGVAPKFIARGWIMGRDAMQAKYLKNHGGRGAEFFVPQSDLNMSRAELLEFLDQERRRNSA